ncbi:fluoride efflux transporter CrcB [Simkania sp.]|uniref:fluoride efflux transporter CrcB n=1 Tax=Simkania sp. TaxID=34094 RepID=UPI003B525239
MIKDILLIACGGGIGAVFRFLFSRGAQSLLGLAFPYGTLLVNLIGAFFIGLISVLLIERGGHFAQDLRALLMIGLLGGFTTFSSFSYETLELWENRELLKAAFYILVSVAFCLIATWCGLTIGRKI